MSSVFNISFNLPLSAIKMSLPEGATVSVAINVPEEQLGSVLGQLPEKKLEGLQINKTTVRKGTVSDVLLEALHPTKGAKARDLTKLVTAAGFAKNSTSSTLTALQQRKMVRAKGGLWYLNKGARG